VAIRILGNGIAGAYLARLFRLRGEEVVVYGRQPKTACGATPCGWGFGPGVWDLIRRAGLDPDDYVLSYDEWAFLEGVEVNCDLVSMDKPRLIADLLQDIEVRYDESPGQLAVIDARGCQPSPLIAHCVQAKVRTHAKLLVDFRSTPGLGYCWRIPLGRDQAHIGVGALARTSGSLWVELKRLIGRYEVICACSGIVDLGGLKPREGWVVGEAAGLVNPLTGEGNVPAMRSAELLISNWPDLAAYQRSLGEFRWTQRAGAVLNSILHGRRLAAWDYLVMTGCFRRSGFYPRLIQFPRLFERIRRGLRLA
jgi:hypothetical protein